MGPIEQLNKRKVAGYGWPGRSAKAVLARRDEGSNPLPSADDDDGRFAPMVKWKSCPASNRVFQVRVLVGVLDDGVGKRDV